MNILREELMKVRGGETSFDTMVARTTEKVWTKVAKRLFFCRRHAAFVEFDDVYQELLVSAYSLTYRWEPRGLAIDGYVMAGSVRHTKGWLAAQSRAHKQRWSNKFRFEVRLADFPDEGENAGPALVVGSAPIEAEVESRLFLHRTLSNPSLTAREKACVDCYVRCYGDTRAAADKLAEVGTRATTKTIRNAVARAAKRIRKENQ